MSATTGATEHPASACGGDEKAGDAEDGSDADMREDCVVVGEGGMVVIELHSTKRL